MQCTQSSGVEKSNYAFAGKNKTVHTKRNIDTCGKDVDYEKSRGWTKNF